MKTGKVPVWLSMKRYRTRKKYQRLKRTVLQNSTQEDEKMSMLEEFDPRGTTVMVASLRIEPLRRWR
ncbi:hypothetical protein F3Y22_tig00110785pilonHSYRG00052 [Hibiscus syriacus]|uniref:Uncharacterized protein n=1 Tax=Hibiscus syriacus TaxID=106335 RepID=A0A6A2ZQZ5_HIBSY|nr:hypothetical protein F3Y22_tig00110785pilonHSYRG00052 [Hibiscus syriacus]